MENVKPKPEESEEKIKLGKVNLKNFGPGEKCKYIRDTPPKYKYIKSDKQKAK